MWSHIAIFLHIGADHLYTIANIRIISMLADHQKIRNIFTRSLRQQLSEPIKRMNVFPSKEQVYILIKLLLGDQQMKPSLIELIRSERTQLKGKVQGEDETMIIRTRIKKLMDRVIMDQCRAKFKKQKNNKVIQIDSESEEVVEVPEIKSIKESKVSDIKCIKEVKEVKDVRELSIAGNHELDVDIDHNGKIVIKSIRQQKQKNYEDYKGKMARTIDRHEDSSQSLINVFQSAQTQRYPLTASICLSEKSKPSRCIVPPQLPLVVTDPYIKSAECGHFIQGDCVSKIIDHYPIAQGMDCLLLVEWQKRADGVVPQNSLLPLSEWKYYKPREAETYAALFDFNVSREKVKGEGKGSKRAKESKR